MDEIPERFLGPAALSGGDTLPQKVEFCEVLDVGLAKSEQRALRQIERSCQKNLAFGRLFKPWIRLRWAKSISTFFLRFIEIKYWSALAISQVIDRKTMLRQQRGFELQVWQVC